MRHVDTIHGWIEYQRCRHYCSACQAYSYPLDEELGVRKGAGLSPKKEEQITMLAVHMPYHEVEKVYAELRGLRTSRTTAQRRVQALGKALRASPPPTQASPKGPKTKAHVTADAAMVYLRQEGWKETKVGACYQVDESREARGIRYGATLGVRDTLGQKLYELAGRPSLGETQGMGFVSDAAPWLGELRAVYFPESTEIVDFFHATEYLWKVAHAFYGEGTPQARKWAEAKVFKLKQGDQRGLKKSLSRMQPKTKEQKEALKAAKRYFANHGHKMDYPRYEALGFHIGSGIAEAACKHVIQSRFKRAGMRWSREGAENLLQLRTLYLNHQWNQLSQYQFN